MGGDGNDVTLTVIAGPATDFAVSAPASATAGTAFAFTVTALDQFNNTATSYAGTVHFTSSDGAATLPANSTLTNRRRGVPGNVPHGPWSNAHRE